MTYLGVWLAHGPSELYLKNYEIIYKRNKEDLHSWSILLLDLSEVGLYEVHGINLNKSHSDKDQLSPQQ